MNIKNNQFWFWGFIVLATLIISAGSTIGYRAYKFHSSHHSRKADHHHSKWNSLDFSKQQHEFIRETRIEHRKKMTKLKTKQRSIHNKLFSEISKQNTDTALIADYKTQSFEISSEIMDETIRFYEVLKTELNEEQMQMINSHLSQRFCKKPTKHKFNKN